jgi:hypothetical protein
MPDRPEIKYKTGRVQLEAVCDALRKSHGLVEPAARLLGMDGGNLRKYIRTHAKCQAVKVEAREKIKDKAESELVQLLNEHDWRAIQFVLLTLGKDRGYALKNATLNTGDVSNSVTIQNVTIQSIESGRFLDGDGSTLEHDSDASEANALADLAKSRLPRPN